MGWVKEAKATAMLTDAQSAWNDGSTFFTPIINVPTFKSNFSGRIKDWEPMLDAIISVGWQLHQWAVCCDANGRPQAMPIFIR